MNSDEPRQEPVNPQVSSTSAISLRGRRLADLLLPHADPALPLRRAGSGEVEAFRFNDAPPAMVRRALAEVPGVANRRPNRQPEAGWLLEMAEQFDGRLCGAVDVRYAALRVDAICVPADALTDFMGMLAAGWPGQDETAVAEAWSAWDATAPLWTGAGSDVRTLIPAARVYSLWWD